MLFRDPHHVIDALISKWRSIWTSLDPTKLKLSSVQQLNINQLDIMNSLRIARTALRVRPTAIRAPLQRRGYAEAVSDKVGIPRQILRPQLTSSRSSCPWLCPIRYVEVFSELHSNTLGTQLRSRRLLTMRGKGEEVVDPKLTTSQ
jgi:hypothetical protein